MIFITTGSRSFQFNRLLKAVDEAIEAGLITEPVFTQIGSSDYRIKNYEYVEFLNHDEFNSKMNSCDLVLTHGGTGVIVNSVKLGKRVVAVPRLAKYGEVVDDHQTQLIKAFEKLEMVTPCFECTPETIAKAIEEARQKSVKPFVSNTKQILDSIDSMIISDVMGVTSKNQKTRIIMCSSARNEKGGMNSVIDQLMDHTWDDSLEFSYLATHVSGNPIKKTLFFAKAYCQLKKLIKKNTFDIIHIHMSYKGSFYRKYAVTKLCKKNNKKVIIHLHGSEFKDFYNNGNEKRKRQIRELFTIADVSIVLGDDWKKFIKKIAPKSNVVVVNNAIALPEVEEKRQNQKLTFLFLGALIKRKGVIDLLTAVQEIKKEGINNLRLLVAGSGEEEENLKKFVAENNLGDCVEFLGWINNAQKPGLLQKSDVLVLPSYNEGLPIAILEAMSYGLPVISTDVGSIKEAVMTGKNGCLFKPGDIEAMASEMKKMILDGEYWQQSSLNSREVCEEKFGDRVFFEKVQNIYFGLR
ncbi:MAG: PssE/Cps14G family polysaccharide biosynthesis glycosyltransferase [Sphaerochaeta sp.]